MLGEKISHAKGKVTTRRVLSTDGPTKIEVSFEASGELLGVAIHEFGTYWQVLRPDGTMYGEGQGVVMGAGGEMATWKGQGVGFFKDHGAVCYRGAVYYQTQSDRWTRLHRVAGVFEFEVDADGNSSDTVTEWR